MPIQAINYLWEHTAYMLIALGLSYGPMLLVRKLILVPLLVLVVSIQVGVLVKILYILAQPLSCFTYIL